MIADDRLSVLGRAEGELAPDRIEWTLIVHERDADARATAERMASAAGRTLERVVSVRDPRADEADGNFY